MPIGDCTVSEKIYSIFLLIVAVVLWISTFPIIYQFVRKYIHVNKSTFESNAAKRMHRLFYIGLVFIFLTFLALLIDIVLHIFGCLRHNQLYTEAIWNISSYLFSSLYVIQFYFLLLLLFMRIHTVFMGSVFHLSNHTVIMYKIIYAFMPITMITCVVMFSFNSIIFGILAALTVLMIMILVISLMILFTYKLIKVYKIESNANVTDKDHLINVITKNTILTLSSLSMTFIQIIAVICQTFVLSNMNGIDPTGFTTLIDLYTNMICFLLTYNEFNSYYYKLCKCVDVKCKHLCGKMVGSDIKMLEMELDVTSKSNNSAGNTIAMH
eukprot:477521_1